MDESSNPQPQEWVRLGCPSAEWLEDAQLRIAGRERQCLSRLLHNGLSQTLSGAQLMVTVLEKQVQSAAPEHLELVRAFGEELRAAAQSVKKLTTQRRGGPPQET